MRKIILATAAGFLAMSSIALAQTSSTPGTPPSGSATTTGQGTSSGGGGGNIADPARKGVEQSPGGTRGTETPGSQTTGGGMQPSDRSMGSKSGGN
jgi:hypothetical protein